mgnify:CR=1 FL=1
MSSLNDKLSDPAFQQKSIDIVENSKPAGPGKIKVLINKIKGKIQAQGIQVHGQLENDINCKGLVKIFKTGKVSGKLSYLEIDIERGGQFVGVMSHTKS